MTPDQLQQIIDRMTPGIWYADVTPSRPSGQICRSEQIEVVNGPSIAAMPAPYDATDYRIEAHRWQRNASGMATLRNHASALVECAKLLREASECLNYDSVLYRTGLSGEIDAALKRLEEI
jgi:hypothetical protein